MKWVSLGIGVLLIGVTPACGAGFLRAAGTHLVDPWMDTATLLRGIGVARAARNDAARAREDIAKIAALGANAVRLDMDYRWFEDGSEAKSFQFIDTFLLDAVARNLRVILSMSRTPGMDSGAPGTVLWDDQDNQDRLVDLWVSIAERYRNHPEIAAYHLMADPEPPDAHDYVFFVQYLMDSIREVDTNHLIIVPEPRTANGLFDFGGEITFLFDNNLAYGFSDYDPEPFTRQGTGGWPAGVVWPGEILESVRTVGDGGRRTVQGKGVPQLLKLESVAPDGADYIAPRLSSVGVGPARFDRILLEEIAVFNPAEGNRAVYSDTRAEWEGMGPLMTQQPFTPLDVRRLPRATPNRRYRLTAEITAADAVEAGIGIVFLSEKKYFSDLNEIGERYRSRAEWGKKAGAPLVLMEFSAPRIAPDESEIRWMNAVTQSCETAGISWVYQRVPETDSSSAWPELQKFLSESFKGAAGSAGDIFDHIEGPSGGENPVPPPKTGCWFGAQASDSPAQKTSPTTFTSIMRFSRLVNKSPAWVHVLHSWKDNNGRWTEFPEEEFREIAAAGAVPFLTWESQWEGGPVSQQMILEGAADTYIRTWADAARRYDKPFVLRLSRGIESAAFRHVQAIFNDKGATHISWMWAPVISPEEPDWPWDSRVDWIGFDIYDRPQAESRTGENTGPFPAADVIAFINAVKKYHTPVCLAEVGCEAVKGQAEWWADALNQLQKPELAPVRAIILMESLPFTNPAALDLHLRNDAAYFIGKELKQPYFIGGD